MEVWFSKVLFILKNLSFELKIQIITTGLYSKSQTMEMKDKAETRVWKLKRCILLYCVTPSEIIILILFEVILGKERWVILCRGQSN